MHGNKGRELYWISADPMLWEKLMTTPSTPTTLTAQHTHAHTHTQLPSSPVCFMHLQTSVTLIDTLWNSLELHFHMKSRTSSQKHRGLAGHYGAEEPRATQNSNLLHPPPYLHPGPNLRVPLINEKIKYQSRIKLHFFVAGIIYWLYVGLVWDML